jgi:hypothetical protein
MIQRIQTVYLFIAILLTGSLFFLPFAELTNTANELFRLDAKGLYQPASPNSAPLFANTIVVILCASCIALMIITIFRYKMLSRQISLSKITVVALFILTGVIFYEIWKAAGMVGGTFSIKIYSSFPAVSIILVWLAMRGMHKDDQLLKSIDRIR